MNHRTDGSTVIGGRATEAGSDDQPADLLDDPHCKYLLEYLEEIEDPADEATAAAYVVSEITDTPRDEVGDDVRRRVQTWLHHGQLPMLDDHGVVEFDPQSGTVSLDGDPGA